MSGATARSVVCVIDTPRERIGIALERGRGIEHARSDFVFTEESEEEEMKIECWDTIESEELLETPIFSVGRHLRKHPERAEAANFYRVSPPDWVNILALTPEDEIVLVRQYRHGSDEITLEIPGGAIDPGEDPLVAGARELREETGYTCESWEQVGRIDVNPAFMTNHCTTLLGRGARQTDPQDFDEHEELAVETYSVERFLEMIDEGSIDHGIVVSAAYYLMRALAR